jgi:uncharacterized membrane protein
MGVAATMPSRPASSRQRDIRQFHVRNLGQYFLRGILVLAPIAITFTVILWLFRKLDGWVNPYVDAPGAGLLAMIVLILLVGWFSSFFLVQRTFRIVDRVLEHMPGVSFIYSSVRDFLEAFVGRKRRFTQAVLVNVFADEVWILGFLTDESAGSFDLGENFVSVYVPQAYNVAGQLYLVPRERVRLIENHPSPDVMKYAVTGGAVELNGNGNGSAARNT